MASEWLVHVAGPDDLIDAGSWLDAVRTAHSVNTVVLRDVERLDVRERELSPYIWATPRRRHDGE